VAKRRTPSRRTPAQRAAAQRAQRGPSGRFLSLEQMQARAREELQRVRDLAFLTPAQFRKYSAAQRRQSEVKAEKQDRKRRAKKNRKAYAYSRAPDNRTLAQAEQINSQVLPAPTDVESLGDLTVYIWSWQGAHSIQTAIDFLYLAEERMPQDSRGYASIGTGYGVDATWVGTSIGRPIDVARNLATLHTSKSDDIQRLFKQSEVSKEAVSIRTEVKLTTKGRVKFNAVRAKAKAVKGKASRAKGSKGKRKKARASKAKRGARR